jgi:hypothetical protein
MRELKDIISESFNKEYGYKIKVAKDCSSEDLAKLEAILSKYNVVSATPWKRAPIQENPIEFSRLKGAHFTSEVSSTDVILKYPVNDRVLEVYVAVNLGVDHERVLCYAVKDPRKAESEIAAEVATSDVDRHVNEDDAELTKEEQAHYEAENVDVDFSEALFGEEYFRNYPTKDNLMGEKHAATMDTLMNTPNMGKGAESTKHVHDVSQTRGARSS